MELQQVFYRWSAILWLQMDTLADLLGTSSESLRMTEKQQRVIRAAAKRDLNDPATTKAEIAEEANVDPTYIDHVLPRINEDVLEYFRETPPGMHNGSLSQRYGTGATKQEEQTGDDVQLDRVAWMPGTSFIMNSGGVPLLVEVSIPRSEVSSEVEKRLTALFSE